MKRLLLLLVCAAPAVAAQTYNQSVLGAILERQAPLPDAPVEYAVWRVDHESGNSIYARHALYLAVGEGDVALGRQRLALAQLLGQPAAASLRGSLSVAPLPCGHLAEWKRTRNRSKEGWPLAEAM